MLMWNPLGWHVFVEFWEMEEGSVGRPKVPLWRTLNDWKSPPFVVTLVVNLHAVAIACGSGEVFRPTVTDFRRLHWPNSVWMNHSQLASWKHLQIVTSIQSKKSPSRDADIRKANCSGKRERLSATKKMFWGLYELRNTAYEALNTKLELRVTV